MEELPLLLFGSFLLIGYLANILGTRTHIPRVTLLLLLGIAAGPNVLNLIPENAAQWFPVVSQAALSVIGFELGEKFLGSQIRKVGKALFIISIVKVVGTSMIVLGILLLFDTPPVLALLLAGIATATDPAATADIIYEVDAEGDLTESTLRMVAIDDAWGVILFSVILAIASTFAGDNSYSSLIAAGLREILGALLLGVIVGVPMAWVTGRVSKGELTLIETLGFVFVCGGLAAALDLSYILACMTMGAVVSNTARHHTRPFHAIHNVRQPFLIMFFLLAGYHADLVSLGTLGVLAALYMLGRTLGGICAGYLGAMLGGFPASVRNYIGFCMLPQAGVAMGLALLAAERFPELATEVISVAVGTSVLFEVIGPVFTRIALGRAGEIK